MKKEQAIKELELNIKHQIGKPKEPFAVGYTVEEGIYVLKILCLTMLGLPFETKK